MADKESSSKGEGEGVRKKKKFFPTIHDGGRQKEKEEWRALNGKTPFRGKFENSLKRGQLRRRIQRVENGGHSRVCLRVLARLNAASSSSLLPPQLPPFVLLILSSHFTATLVHLYPPLSLSLYLLPSISLTLPGRGKRVLSLGESFWESLVI